MWIYDTLMSSRGGLALESTVGGSIVQSFKSKNQLLIFNGDKAGQMALYDLKMNKQILTSNIHTEEVTSVAMNETETTLVAGFKDGIVKIFNI